MSPTLNVRTTEGEKTIKNKMHIRLLGLNIHEDLSWRSHLELGEKLLFLALRRRLGGLRHKGKMILKNGRKILANSLILSKIIYMIQIWGGTHPIYLKKLQRIMNNTARFILNEGKNGKVED